MTDRLKILIVEDNPLLRMLAQRQIDTLGYASEAVGTGEQAVDLDDGDICLVFMDVGLPGMDGCQATQLIRDREVRSNRKRVPIIALTAHSNKEQCLVAGMDDFLQKPALIADIKSMLDKWLSEEPPAGRTVA